VSNADAKGREMVLEIVFTAKEATARAESAAAASWCGRGLGSYRVACFWNALAELVAAGVNSHRPLDRLPIFQVSCDEYGRAHLGTN
jgi:hypothetical protein